MIKNKVFIKENGEKHQIELEYNITQMNTNFTFELGEKIDDMLFTNNSEPVEEGQYYTLSDGKTYHESDVIVGEDKIRDYKIKNII